MMSNAIDEVKMQVAEKIKATQGQDRVILETLEDTGHLGRAFPPGTRAFQIISESAECTHTPRCRWYDVAYVWRGRCVVIAQRDLPRITVGEVVRQLTDGEPHTTRPAPGSAPAAPWS